MAISQDFYKSITTPRATGYSYSKNPVLPQQNPFDFNLYEQPETEPGSLLDFVGSAVWGVGSAFTFGATEFVNPYAEQPWEERSGSAKAGMILGEGLGLFAPWGAFGMLAKGGRALTKAAGANKFIGNASKKVVGNLNTKSVSQLFVDDPKTAKSILDAAEGIAKSKNMSKDAVLRTYGDDIIEGLNKISADDLGQGWVKSINSSGQIAKSSKDNLILSGEKAISDAFQKNGINISRSEASYLSKQWVDELGKGRYVNDIAEWVERTIGGAAPGVVRESVSKYLGMATQDMILMTTHGLITGAVKEAATGELFDPMDSLEHSALMALAFPLIRAFPMGGKDNLMTGFNAYFSRFKASNYNKMVKDLGEGPVRNLLRIMATAPEKRAAWNWSIADRSWTIGKGATKKVYGSADEILRDYNSMPINHVIELLNKMNKKVSQDMLGKWGPKYLWDFTKSIPRMVGGTVITNPWMLEKGAWGAMDSQELGAHVMMSFMMTKGRGAWNANKKQIYFKDFAGHREALRTLHIKPEMAEHLELVYKVDNFEIATGEQAANTKVGNQILKSYDDVISSKDTSSSRERINANDENLLLVTQFAGSYDNMKKASNPDHKPISDRLTSLSKEQIYKIAENIKNVNIAEKGAEPVFLKSHGRDMFWQGMLHMSLEPLNTGMKIYRKMFKELSELGFDITVLQDGSIEWSKTRTKKEGDDSLGRMVEINAVLEGFSKNGDAKPEKAMPKEGAEKTFDRVAKDLGITTEALRARVSEIVERNMELLGSSINSKGEFINAHDNNFLKFYSSAKQVAVHDRIYKIITNKALKGDQQLTEILDSIFMIDGKYANDIQSYKDKIEGYVKNAKEGPEREVAESILENLSIIEPLFSLRKAHLGGGTSRAPKANVSQDQLNTAAQKVKDLFASLPVDIQNNFSKELKNVYMERILSNKGMDSRSMNLAFYLIENRLGVYQDGKIQIASPEAMIQHLREKHGGNVKDSELKAYEIAIKTIKNVLGDTVKFTNKIPVDESNAVITDGVKLSNYVKAYKMLANDSIVALLTTSRKAITDIKKHMNGSTEKLAEITNKITNLVDQLEGVANNNLDPIKEIRKISEQLDVIRESSKNINLDKSKRTDTQKDIDDINIVLKQLIDGIDKQTGQWNMSVDSVKKLLGSKYEGDTDPTGLINLIKMPMQEKIGRMFERELEARNAFEKVLNDLETVALQGVKSYGLSVEDTAYVLNQLTLQWSSLYNNVKGKGQKSLTELIELTNERGSWADVMQVIQSANKTIKERQIVNNKNHPLNSEEALLRESMLKGHTDKEKRLKSPMEIMKEYGLVDKDNNINQDFKEGMLSGEATKIFETMRTHILNNYLDGKKLSAKERAEAFNKFRNRDALTIINYLSNQVPINTIKIAATKGAGTESIIDFNTGKVVVNHPNIRYFREKGYDTVFLEDAVAVVMGGKLRRASLDMEFSSPELVQQIINQSIRRSTKQKDILEKLRDNLNLNEADIQNLILEQNIDKSFYYVRVSPGSRMLFVASKANMDALNKDFNTWYDSAISNLKNNGKTVEAKALESVFGEIRSKQSSEGDARRIVELKMMLPFLDKTMKGNFESWLKAWGESGDQKTIAKIEANLFKRGFLVDGGTTQPVSKDVLRYITGRTVDPQGNVKYLGHTDPRIRSYAEKLLRQDGWETVVFNDSVAQENSSHPLSIRGIVEGKINAEISRLKKAAALPFDNQNLLIIQQHNNTIKEIKSLDNSLFDGAKFASLEAMKFIMAQKGVDADQFINSANGAKTVIFATGDNQLLGKGYLIYHPEIAAKMPAGVDIALGTESAKAYSGKSKANTEYTALDVSTGLDALTNAGNRNKMIIPVEGIGISFMSKNSEKGVISPSIFDFQNSATVQKAMTWMNFESIYKNIALDWNSAHDISRQQVKWLYKQNEEAGNPLDRGDAGIARILFEFGADPNTPLIVSSIKRLMRSQHYQDVNTIENMRGGEDNYLVPNVSGDLALPIYANLTTKKGNVTQDHSRTVINYGGTGINKNQASRILGSQVGRPSINQETFIFRDNQGVDIIVQYENGKFRYQSNFYDLINLKSIDGIKGYDDVGKRNVIIDAQNSRYTDGARRFKRGGYQQVESLLNELNQKVNKFQLTYGETMSLLKGNQVSKDLGEGNVTVALKAKSVDMAKKLNLEFGMLGHAIPAIGHDKVIFRVNKVSDRLNGLAEVNVYDLRVAMQRDNDGDHFYMHQKVPFELLKSFGKQNGKKNDFNMFNTDHVLNNEYVNIFSIDPNTGKAGSVAGGGFHSYASTLSLAKRAIGSTIGTRNAISWMERTGIKFGGEKLFKDFSNEDKITIDSQTWKWLQKYYDVMQNSVDIHSGIHEIIRNNRTLNDFLFYGQVESSIFEKAVKDYELGRGDLRLNKYIKDQSTPFNIDKFGQKSIEKEVFNLLLRTFKKANMISNDVYDEAGSRNPEPFEIKNAHNDLRSFFINPDNFIVDKLRRSIQYKLKNASTRDYGKLLQTEFMEMFFPKVKTGPQFEQKFMRDFFREGFIQPLSKRIFSFDNVTTVNIGTGGSRDPFMMSMGGYHLNRFANLDGFHSKGVDGIKRIESNLKKSNLEAAGFFVDRVERFVETMNMFGRDPIETFNTIKDGEFVYNVDNFSFGLNKQYGNWNAKKAFNNGILRSLIDRQIKEIQNSIEYYRSEKFTNPNKIDRLVDRLSNLKVAADIMDHQTVRDITVEGKNNFIKGQGKDVSNLLKSFTKNKKTIAVWEIKGDVKYKGKLLDKSDKFENESLSQFTTTEMASTKKYVDQKQLNFIGYFNETSFKGNKKQFFQKGRTYIVDTKPKKYVNISDLELKWNRALFNATYGKETLDHFFLERGMINQFYADLKKLRAQISTGHFSTVKEALLQKVLSKDFYAMEEAQQSYLISKFIDKYKGSISRDVDRVDFLLRNILKPQIAATYTSDDAGRYVPNFTTNQHLQKTVFRWSINAEGGKYKSFLENFIKDVSSFYNGTKEYKLEGYDRAVRNEVVEMGTPFETMLKYMDVFYANPYMEMQAGNRYNSRMSRVRTETDQVGQQHEYITVNPVKRKPSSFKGDFNSALNGKPNGC